VRLSSFEVPHLLARAVLLPRGGHADEEGYRYTAPDREIRVRLRRKRWPVESAQDSEVGLYPIDVKPELLDRVQADQFLVPMNVDYSVVETLAKSKFYWDCQRVFTDATGLPLSLRAGRVRATSPSPSPPHESNHTQRGGLMILTLIIVLGVLVAIGFFIALGFAASVPIPAPDDELVDQPTTSPHRIA
jgi:hypothetical protein